MLTREEILANKMPTQVVPVPAWGGDVLVRGLNWKQRRAFLDLHLIPKDDGKSEQSPLFAPALVAGCCINPDGSLLFTESDVEALAEQDADAVAKLFVVARDLSGLKPDDPIDREKKD